MRVVVTAISFVDVGTANLHPGELLHVGDRGAERVPVEGIAMQGLGMEHELSAPPTREERTNVGAKENGLRRLFFPSG
jgi:hypothetical protein